MAIGHQRRSASHAELRVAYPSRSRKAPGVPREAPTCNHSLLIDSRGENRGAEAEGITRRKAASRLRGRVKRSNHSFGRADKSVSPDIVGVADVLHLRHIKQNECFTVLLKCPIDGPSSTSTSHQEGLKTVDATHPDG